MGDISKTKILILGGRRAGKSTILSHIAHSLINKVSHLATIKDVTPYKPYEREYIKDRLLEIEQYIRKRNEFGENSRFIVDFSPSPCIINLNLDVSIQGASSIELDFVVPPGESLLQYSGYNSHLASLVKESDIFVIAIDTPYLMQDERPGINAVWNRTDEIENLLANIIIEDERDKKLILFVPVKCEKWVNSNEIDKVTERVLQAYHFTINRWVNNPAVEMWVMPVETAGGIEHTRLLDAYRFYRDNSDILGDICSIDPLTDLLMLRDGTILQRKDVEMVESEPDGRFKVSYVQMPLSWYKTTGIGFKPRNCEQIAYHILRFFVEKQENIEALNNEENLNKSLLKRMFNSTSRFGRHLPKYRELINQIPVKTSGDGFHRIETMVNVPEEDCS